MKRFFISSLFVILKINAILAFDTLIPLLDFEKSSDIDYYNNLFKENDFYVSTDTMWSLGEPKFSRDYSIYQSEKPNFKITLDYTPKSRLVYYAYIKGEVDKEQFVKELLAFYSDLIDKYNLPDSAYYCPDGHYESSNEKRYFAVELIGGKDTTKIREFFEQAIPFCIIWEKKFFNVSLKVDKKYNVYYSPDFTCTIINKKADDIYANELSEIIADRQQKEDRQRWINIGLIIVGIIVVFFLGRIIIKGYLKQRDAEWKEQKEDAERRENIQRKVDNEYEDFIRELTDKYGSITRTIPFKRYDADFVTHYDDILVFEQANKIIFGKTEYSFSDILSCSMYDENQKEGPVAQVTRTKTASMLGRAAIGGLTLGVAGAVVGAITATKETRSPVANAYYVPSYVVKIGVKSIENPIITLHLYRDQEQAETLYAVMQTIISMK